MKRIGFFLAKTFKDMVRDRRRVLPTLATLLAVFVVLVVFMLAATNVQRILAGWREDLVLTVYLSENVSEVDVERLGAALKQTPEVSDVTYLSPGQSREELAGLLGKDSGLVQRMDASLFPGMFEVHIDSAYLDTGMLAGIQSRIESLDTVDQVVTYSDWYTKLTSLAGFLRTASLLFGLLVALMTIIVVAATVRLALANRSREFEVMKLCGASNGFIAAPLVIEGGIIALLAMGLALACGYGICSRFGAVAADVGAILRIREASFFSASAILLLLAGSGVLGATGSRLALRRHLRV